MTICVDGICLSPLTLMEDLEIEKRPILLRVKQKIPS
jgi:hypothetical protein